VRKDWTLRTPGQSHQVLHGIVPLRNQISSDAPAYSIVQPQKRRTPDLEIVVGTEVTSWIDVNTDVFLQRFQVP
jgi:hypothetical protein